MQPLMPNFDPVIFSLGPLQVRWYGLMYVIGFLLGGRLYLKLCREKFVKLPVEKLDMYIFHIIIGMFLGARLLFVFVYNWDYYSENLSEIFTVWKGGLSFHGGFLGFVIVCIIYSKKYKIPFFNLADGIVLTATPGLFFGRMGNFINGELYGRITDVPWGMIFHNGGPYPRHPSQLYEGIGEGVILLAILWILKYRVKYQGILSATFLIGYGCIRFTVEFFREPDVQLGYYFGGTTTMGQILCMLMIIAGIGLMTYSIKSKELIMSVKLK
ncbi:MAG: prolipoprotein diacylglyceryl transferase [Oligoflexia bacterium]|nr:prolipoprotein diacylglyceryl transferase [Oligoflexia bacterium]